MFLRRSETEDIMMEADVREIRLQAKQGGGGHLLEAGKDKETDSPLEPQEGTQSCQHLNFSPIGPIFDISPQESITY